MAGGRQSIALSQAGEIPAARPFELYEARGGEHGLALDDWLRAEREIDAEIGELNRHDEDED